MNNLTPEALALQLRTGENPRLPALSPAGKRDAQLCAVLLQRGAPLPLWALA